MPDEESIRPAVLSDRNSLEVLALKWASTSYILI